MLLPASSYAKTQQAIAVTVTPPEMMKTAVAAEKSARHLRAPDCCPVGMLRLRDDRECERVHDAELHQRCVLGAPGAEWEGARAPWAPPWSSGGWEPEFLDEKKRMQNIVNIG